MKASKYRLAAVACFLFWGLQASPEPGRKVLLENDRVRVRQVILEPSVQEPRHTHELPHVGIIIRGGKLEFHENDQVEIVEFEAGDAGWREAGVTHSIINLSETPVHVVEVELK